MTLPVLWNQSWTAPLINHVWQTTAVTLIVWLLALMLRNNQARTRYWLWMIASVKFLIPFSLFVAAGESLRPMVAAPIHGPAITAVMARFAQPFPPQFFPDEGTPITSPNAGLLPSLLLVAWAFGVFSVAFSWWRKWRQIRLVVRAAAPAPFAPGVPVFTSSSLVEPGVLGILRPVLLLPEGILDRLSPAQLDAIFAHEICHVRRRDNLTFAVHMIVEALFWFHPLVWWIETRLVQERELACDEAVLQSGSDPEVYAEGILNVCKFCVESPLACISGVSGADLKKRIVHIMAEQVACRLDLSRKLLLCAACLLTVAVPTVLGLAHAGQLLAQTGAEEQAANLPKYAVATIKPTSMEEERFMSRLSPDGVRMEGVPVQEMLRTAFGVEQDRLLGVPSWAKSDRYDIEAKVEPADAPKLEGLTLRQRQAMLLPLLTDRFNMKYHHETRELPVYVLTIAKGGSKLMESKPEPAQANHAPLRKMMMGRGSFESQGGSVAALMQALSMQLGRTIIDKTGLTGNYDFTLKWTPDTGSGPMMPGPDGGPPGGDNTDASDANGPSLFTALQEQLGLKLEPEKGPVDVIVIDRLDQPSPN
jgi:uncharacterized protein (TIGR03435 family)